MFMPIIGFLFCNNLLAGLMVSNLIYLADQDFDVLGRGEIRARILTGQQI